MGQDSPERDHVLCVVASHHADRSRGTTAQERVVDGGDLPGRNVRRAVAAEKVPLHRLEAGIGQTMPEEPPHQQQKIQMAVEGGRNAAAHAEAGLEERPVEGAAVVCDQAGTRRCLCGEGV